MLYFALINSKSQYGTHGWGATFENLMTKIRQIQKFFMIILYKNKKESYFNLFKHLNILPLQHLHIFCICNVTSATELVMQGHDTRSR